MFVNSSKQMLSCIEYANIHIQQPVKMHLFLVTPKTNFEYKFPIFLNFSISLTLCFRKLLGIFYF